MVPLANPASSVLSYSKVSMDRVFLDIGISFDGTRGDRVTNIYSNNRPRNSASSPAPGRTIGNSRPGAQRPE
ncbi:hypothetical protein PoB_000317900 [Plakobranchus ocellatus]|uniref:Uncharacterized protein n=1 Tax=Plakobranchus ocellatus TaxID=259542 RepID=A0AAV3Y3L8_9GAST|nr:hypothetical protein PoB_000317900 [Plakobranchus ocellatus]